MQRQLQAGTGAITENILKFKSNVYMDLQLLHKPYYYK